MSVARFAVAIIVVNLCLIAFGIAHGRAQSPAWHNVATEVGLTASDSTWSINPADFDKDGDTDLLYIPHYPELKPDIPRPTLYENQDGHFVEKSVAWPSRDRHDCDFADLDRDGDRDIFCAVGSTSRSRNEVMEQRDGTFVDASGEWGELDVPVQGRTRTVELFRADANRTWDVYVTRFSGWRSVRPNRFYINRHDDLHNASHFGLDTEESTIHGVKTCNDAVDYNSDGHQDLMVCTAEGFRLYKNIRGQRFAERAQRWGIGGSWYDAEIIPAQAVGQSARVVRIRPQSLEVRTLDGAHSRVVASWPMGGAGWNLASGDYDSDGDMDVYAARSCVARNPLRDSTADLSDFVVTNTVGGFELTEIPKAPHGCGQSVESLDYDSDGRDEFVVLNGREGSRGAMVLWSYK